MCRGPAWPVKVGEVAVGRAGHLSGTPWTAQSDSGNTQLRSRLGLTLESAVRPRQSWHAPMDIQTGHVTLQSVASSTAGAGLR